MLSYRNWCGSIASQSARNYLGMGSGFYESSDNNNEIPSVLKNIVDTLQEAELLTRQPEIDIFVNPKACQAVANSVPSFNNAGWKVREAGQPECFKILSIITREIHFQRQPPRKFRPLQQRMALSGLRQPHRPRLCQPDGLSKRQS